MNDEKHKYDTERNFRNTTMSFNQKKKFVETKKNVTSYNWPKPEQNVSSKNYTDICINLTYTKYPIIEYIVKKVFGWKVVKNDKFKDYDLVWCDGAIQGDMLKNFKLFQKVNHFPGMFALSRKSNLARNLSKMQKEFPESYDFFPQTWLLPAEGGDLMRQFKSNRDNDEDQNKFDQNNKPNFILKPEAGAQGRGIYVITQQSEVPFEERCVVQRYISNPFLIDGLKFDLRIYILILGCDPLRILIFKEGLARFAVETYEVPNKFNKDNRFKHLTNFAINKFHPDFESNRDARRADRGHKRNLAFIWDHLRKKGYSPEIVWTEIKKLALKTIISVHPMLMHNYKSCQPDDPFNQMCFEILGIDILLDDKLKPYLQEVNHSPSFQADTPIDHEVKATLIANTLKILNITAEARQTVIGIKQNHIREKTLLNKKGRLNDGGVKEKCFDQRSEYIRKNLSNFEYIYPIEETIKCLKGAEKDIERKTKFIQATFNENYEDFLDKSQMFYQKFTGGDQYNKRDKRMKGLTDIVEKESFNSYHKNLMRVEKIYSSALNSELKKIKPNAKGKPRLEKLTEKISNQVVQKNEAENDTSLSNTKRKNIVENSRMLNGSKSTFACNANLLTNNSNNPHTLSENNAKNNTATPMNKNEDPEIIEPQIKKNFKITKGDNNFTKNMYKDYQKPEENIMEQNKSPNSSVAYSNYKQKVNKPLFDSCNEKAANLYRESCNEKVSHLYRESSNENNSNKYRSTNENIKNVNKSLSENKNNNQYKHSDYYVPINDTNNRNINDCQIKSNYLNKRIIKSKITSQDFNKDKGSFRSKYEEEFESVKSDVDHKQNGSRHIKNTSDKINDNLQSTYYVQKHKNDESSTELNYNINTETRQNQKSSPLIGNIEFFINSTKEKQRECESKKLQRTDQQESIEFGDQQHKALEQSKGSFDEQCIRKWQVQSSQEKKHELNQSNDDSISKGHQVISNCDMGFFEPIDLKTLKEHKEEIKNNITEYSELVNAPRNLALNNSSLINIQDITHQNWNKNCSSENQKKDDPIQSLKATNETIFISNQNNKNCSDRLEFIENDSKQKTIGIYHKNQNVNQATEKNNSTINDNQVKNNNDVVQKNKSQENFGTNNEHPSSQMSALNDKSYINEEKNSINM